MMAHKFSEKKIKNTLIFGHVHGSWKQQMDEGKTKTQREEIQRRGNVAQQRVQVQYLING